MVLAQFLADKQQILIHLVKRYTSWYRIFLQARGVEYLTRCRHILLMIANTIKLNDIILLLILLKMKYPIHTSYLCVIIKKI